MTKQKKGFWVFIFSLIPGAGEMYMGFRKQGISIMTIFWGIIAFAGVFSFGIPLVALPIVWFYSFFNVHNLKSLTEEEFYSLEDDYAVRPERIIGDKDVFFKKYRTYIAIGIIGMGALALWRNIPVTLQYLVPGFLQPIFDYVVYVVPNILFAIAMIGGGIYLAAKKER